MGVEHVIVFPNLFTYMNKIWLNPLFSSIIIIMYIKDGMKNGREWLREGIVNGSKKL
jgi:hypothetical protein